MGFQNDRIRINVGGKTFETTSITLANAGRNSMLGAMFDDTWNLASTKNDNGNDARHHFLDRNPDCFAVILDFLRTGELHIPAAIPEKLFYREALYYGLLDRVRAAKWGPLDGNLLKFSRSLACRARSKNAIIRGSPDGGCCVADGCMVYAYDWIMDEHPPINLAYQRVNDVGWVDSSNIAVGVRSDKGSSGGIGLFNSWTGELRNTFEVCHEGQVRSYTAGALCFNRDNKIMSSCKGRSNEYGVGVWDLVTGQQLDFFYEPNEWSLGESNKLQWLDDCNGLLVATLLSDSTKRENYLSLLDFREKRMVWSWSDQLRHRGDVNSRLISASVATEDNRFVWVADEPGNLGFLDLRSSDATTTGITWSSNDRYMVTLKKWSQPHLALHGGQLFLSLSDCISVYSVSNLVLTSKLRRNYNDLICDFSISGDRLFALHQGESVFDVWETPTPPII